MILFEYRNMAMYVNSETIKALKDVYDLDAEQMFHDSIDSFLDSFILKQIVATNERFDLFRSIHIKKGIVTMTFYKISN